jgi:hypothetical protein
MTIKVNQILHSKVYINFLEPPRADVGRLSGISREGRISLSKQKASKGNYRR